MFILWYVVIISAILGAAGILGIILLRNKHEVIKNTCACFILFGFLLALILGSISLSVDIQVKEEILTFEETTKMYDALNETSDPAIRLSLMQSVNSCNIWLRNARINQQVRGRCSIYYGYDLTKYDYIGDFYE